MRNKAVLFPISVFLVTIGFAVWIAFRMFGDVRLPKGAIAIESLPPQAQQSARAVSFADGVYRNEFAGYAFRVPDGWAPYGRHEDNFRPAADQSDEVTMAVFRFENPYQFDLDTWVESQELKTYTLGAMSPITVGEREGYSYAARWEDDGYSMGAVVMGETGVFELECFYSKTDAGARPAKGQCLSALTESLRSFHVLR